MIAISYDGKQTEKRVIEKNDKTHSHVGKWFFLVLFFSENLEWDEEAEIKAKNSW